MFKFELNKEVYYLLDNKIHSGTILSRYFVDNLYDDWDSTKEQKDLFKPFGDAGILYSTCHGVFLEVELFESKEELVKSIYE